MKNTLIAIVAIIALFISPTARAQDANSDAAKSLEVARNMVLAVSGLADDFKKYKDDFIKKDESGNAYYLIKDLQLGTDAQYVIVKPNGTTVIAAIYTGANKEDKSVAMAFAAFTGGIITLTGTKDFSVDADKSSDKNTLKYFLKLKDTNVASFSYSPNDNEGLLLIAVQ